jgi:ribosome maturation factor RimP
MRRAELQESMSEAVMPVLAGIGYDLVEVRVVVSHGRRTLRIFIDKRGGVNVGDCAIASRAISAVLDESGLFQGRYFLEVSSPGAERPLRGRRDFERFAGRKARLRVKSEDSGIKVLEGIIGDLEGDELSFELVDGTRIAVPFEEIAKANLSL